MKMKAYLDRKLILKSIITVILAAIISRSFIGMPATMIGLMIYGSDFPDYYGWLTVALMIIVTVLGSYYMISRYVRLARETSKPSKDGESRAKED
jgi:cytochrome c biogenesis protein CcdA